MPTAATFGDRCVTVRVPFRKLFHPCGRPHAQGIFYFWRRDVAFVSSPDTSPDSWKGFKVPTVS